MTDHLVESKECKRTNYYDVDDPEYNHSMTI